MVHMPPYCVEGYVFMRHNSIRDMLAELLSEICKDVVTGPSSFPLLVKPYQLVPTSVKVQDWTLVVVTDGPRC